MEATNLLRIPGRQVARPGEKSANPHIELEPAAIQKSIGEDPATWTTLINGLHDAAVPALNATNAKHATDLFDAGDKLEKACESCHQHYSYPPKNALWMLTQTVRVREGSTSTVDFAYTGLEKP